MAEALVVFVHGIFSSAKAWDPFLKLLKIDPEVSGQYEFRCFEYSTPRIQVHPARRIPDLNVVADRLATLLETDYKKYPRLILVGHSQGGLVIQRFLARQLAEGRGNEIARIRGIVLFACPSNGSEFQLSLRTMLLGWNRQVKALRPLTDAILETQRHVLAEVVYANSVDERRCPIPLKCYAGELDNVVAYSSARSVFPSVGTLPGDHSTIIAPDHSLHPAYVSLREDLSRGLTAPFPAAVTGSSVGSGPEDSDVFVEMLTHGPVNVVIGPDRLVVPINVRSGPVDQVRNIDIVATSENIYMQMAMTFKPSVSGRLRRAAAKKGPAGEILEDTASDELNLWMRENGRFGLPVEPGTVAATSSGELYKNGVTRIYHAAIGIPELGSDRFTVSPHSVGQAVHNVFRVARMERMEQGLDLRSMLLPLFGAGIGGLSPSTCFEWMWRALAQELAIDQSWAVSLCTWSRTETEVVLAALQRNSYEPSL